MRENIPMYDLEERTFQFAKAVRFFIRSLSESVANREDGKQLIKSSGSVGSKSRESNESMSKKDFSERIKTCRKDAKECVYWLRLIHECNALENPDNALHLIQEAEAIVEMASDILKKSRH